MMEDEQIPRSIARVLDLLEVVLAAGECTLTTAANRCDLTPTTALRHLRALEARGYVRRDGAGLFSAGPVLFRVAAGLRAEGSIEQLIAAAQPFLDQVAERTGESTYLAVSDGRSASYVATAEGTHTIRHVGWIGQTVSLDGTALGAALEQPGVVKTRTGAVEGEITAMSVALPASELLAAVSVLGPEPRMVANEPAVARALGRAAAALSVGHDRRMAS